MDGWKARGYAPPKGVPLIVLIALSFSFPHSFFWVLPERFPEQCFELLAPVCGLCLVPELERNLNLRVNEEDIGEMVHQERAVVAQWRESIAVVSGGAFDGEAGWLGMVHSVSFGGLADFPGQAVFRPKFITLCPFRRLIWRCSRCL